MTAEDTGLLITRARLFVVSYAALWLMFAARFGGAKDWWVAAAFGVAGIWALADGLRLVRGSRRRSTSMAVVYRIDDHGGVVSAYLATYLLPFLGSMPQNWGDWVALGLYFAVALIVYVRSDLALINPTLYVLGHRVFRGRVGSQEGLIVSAEDLVCGDQVRVSELVGVVVVHEVVKAAADE